MYPVLIRLGWSLSRNSVGDSNKAQITITLKLGKVIILIKSIANVMSQNDCFLNFSLGGYRFVVLNDIEQSKRTGHGKSHKTTTNQCKEYTNILVLISFVICLPYHYITCSQTQVNTPFN